MNILKSIFVKADKVREDVENSIANVLEKFSKSKTLDSAEETLIKAAIAAGLSSASSGSVALSPEQLDSIATSIVKGLNKLDIVVANQLKKQ